MAQPFPSGFTPDLTDALQSLSSVHSYAKGAVLFKHGLDAQGIYLVETGQIRILLPVGQGGPPQLIDVVGPGAVLALSETMSGGTYRVTAEAQTQATTSFVSREQFLEFLRQHNDFCMQVIRLLSEDLHSLYHKFRNISAHPGRPRMLRRNVPLN